MDIIQLLSAAGFGGIVGSLLTTVVQAWLSHKSSIATCNFQEKKEAYVGLLEALHKVKSDQEANTYLALWMIRCELVGSRKVVKAVNEYDKAAFEYHKNPINKDGLIDSGNKIKEAMRKDLGVTAA